MKRVTRYNDRPQADLSSTMENAMKTELTPQQIQSFREAGHITIEGFLSPAELEEWRGAVDEAVTGRGDMRIPALNSRQNDESYYNTVFIQRVNL